MTAFRQTDRPGPASHSAKKVLLACLETRPRHTACCGGSTFLLFAYSTEWLSHSHVDQKDLVQGGAQSRHHKPIDYTSRF
jgi:hypothetical protein